MKVTIGEVVNEVLKYSNSVELNTYKGIPFLTSALSSTGGFMHAYLYICQVSEYQYAAYDDIDVYNGNKILCTGNPSSPFIQEKLFLTESFSNDIGGVNNVYFDELMWYIYKCLMYHRVIKMNIKDTERSIQSFKMKNPKILREVEREFNKHCIRNGTIGDIISIVNIRKESFSLRSLKHEDVNFIVSKLKNHGLNITMKDSTIIDTTFIRRQKYAKY